jgi:hypothetical protein
VPPANSSLPYPVVLPIGALGASRAGYERVSDLDQTQTVVTSAKIYAEGVLQPPTSSRKGGPLLVTSNLPSPLCARRTPTAAWCVGCAMRKLRTKHLSEKYFPATDICGQPAVSTRVGGYMRGAGGSGSKKINAGYLALVFSCPSPVNSLGDRSALRSRLMAARSLTRC